MVKPIDSYEEYGCLKTRVNGVILVLTILSGLIVTLLSQGTSIRSEVAKEIARIDIENQKVTDRLDDHDKLFINLGRRVTSLEGR
jgi:hypothetical protein